MNKNNSTNAILRIMPSIVSSFLPFGVILFATFMCYSGLIARNPQGNFTHIIKWDIFDFTYPALIFNSDSMRNFIFPLWNPYTFAGKPYISNPQACLFNPVNLLFIIFKGYSLELLQIQLFITFFIAGISMYLCLKNFFLSKTASLIGAISFLGSGFFVGNAEHFSHINILAFLPLSLLSLNKIISGPNLYNLSFGALTLPLLAFCGYPTMLALCLYMLFIFGTLKVFFIDKKYRKNLIFKKSIYLLAFFVLGLCASALLLMPVFENAAFSVRSGGAPLESIKVNSLPFVYLGSLCYPFLVLRNFVPMYFEVTFRNCSIGIVGILFAIYYLLFNRGRLKWVLSLFLLLSFIMTLGANIPVYIPLIKFIPFLKHVRHPALDYRAFLIFFLCLAAGFGAQDMLGSYKKNFKKCLIAFFFFLFIALTMFFYIKSVYNIGIMMPVIQEHKFLLISIFFLLIITASAKINISKKYFCIMLIVFCIIDISHWVKANFVTVADPVENAVWVFIKNAEATRDTKVDNNAIFKRREGEYPISIRGNFAMMYKYFSNSGYDPFILRYFDDISRSPNNKIITEDFRILPIYDIKLLPDEESVLSDLNKGRDLHKTALINESDIKSKDLLYKLRNLTYRENNNFSARILRYSPNCIYYAVKTEAPILVFFNEIYYPGWHLFSNKKAVTLFKVNHAFRGAYLEAGEHYLKMYFFPASFKIGLITSIFSLVFIFFTVFLKFLRIIIIKNIKI